MKLSSFSRALHVVLFVVAGGVPKSAAEQSSDGGGIFFPRSEPPPAEDPEDGSQRVIIEYKDAAGRGAALSNAKKVHRELGPQNAVAATVTPEKLVGLANNPHIEFIEADVPRQVLGSVRGGAAGRRNAGGRSMSSPLGGVNDAEQPSVVSKEVHRRLAQVQPYGIAMVQADQVIEDASDGTRTLCIIDSGYDGTPNLHEDLPVANGSNDSRSGAWNDDTCSHGTHVAGTIAAVDNDLGVVGVMPGSKLNIYIVKVFDGTGCGWAYSSSLVAALNDCEANGANIVSMSLGGSFSSSTEDTAFQNAYNNGILSIAAAGNGGNKRHSYPASYSSVISVAAIDSAKTVADFSQTTNQVELAAPGVAVRSTVRTGTGFDESASVGGTGYEVTAMQDSPDATATGNLFRCNAADGLGSPGDCAGATGKICLISRGTITFAEKVQECQNQGGAGAIIFNNAPALFSGTLAGASTSIPSVGMSGDDGAALEGMTGTSATVTTMAGGNYAFYDGTSMATPHVAGVAALVWSKNTTCTNAQIRTLLQDTAEDLGAAGRDNAYGYGLVQAADAVAAIDAYCGGGGGGGTGCNLGAVGDSCTSDSECCSNSCKGPPNGKTCK